MIKQAAIYLLFLASPLHPSLFLSLPPSPSLSPFLPLHLTLRWRGREGERGIERETGPYDQFPCFGLPRSDLGELACAET